MSDKPVIHVIDDDAAMRDSLAFLLDVNGFAPRTHETANAFLSAARIDAPATRESHSAEHRAGPSCLWSAGRRVNRTRGPERVRAR